MAIKTGDAVAYSKTGTTGRVVKIICIDNKMWAELDSTGLLYDENVLESINPSKLKEEGRKERMKNMEKKESREDLEKEMKDEGTLDSSAGICGAG